METKAITEKLRVYIGKCNRQLFGWVITWIIGVLMFLTTDSDKTTLEKMNGFNAGLACMLIFLATQMYIDKYMRFFGTKDTDKIEDISLLRNESLTDIMRCHSFDMKLYFRSLFLRMIPIMAVSVAVLVQAGVFKLIRIENALIFAALVVFIPAVNILIRYFVAAYCMNHRLGLAIKIVFSIARGIYNFLRIFTVGVSAIMIDMLVLAILSSSLLMKGIDQNAVVRFESNTGFTMLIIIVGTMLFTLFITDTDKELLATRWVKFRNKLMVLTFMTVIIVGIAYVYLYLNNNVMLTEDSIMVNHFGEKTEYAIDDITGYRVCYREDMDMDITFSDGRVENIFRDTCDDTDAWRAKYYSDYNYAAELMGKLSERGVKGTVDDEEMLLQSVSGYDKECRDGLDEMLKIAAQ